MYTWLAQVVRAIFRPAEPVAFQTAPLSTAITLLSANSIPPRNLVYSSYLPGLASTPLPTCHRFPAKMYVTGTTTSPSFPTHWRTPDHSQSCKPVFFSKVDPAQSGTRVCFIRPTSVIVASTGVTEGGELRRYQQQCLHYRRNRFHRMPTLNSFQTHRGQRSLGAKITPRCLRSTAHLSDLLEVRRRCRNALPLIVQIMRM